MEGEASNPSPYELRIAADQTAAGFFDAFRVHAARRAGIEPDRVTSSYTRPPDLPEDAEPCFSYRGHIYITLPPDEDIESAFYMPRSPPRIQLKDTGVPFCYNPLDPDIHQLRLLRLADPDEDGVVSQLKLETFRPEDAPPYLCLSYVWGDPEKFIKIPCNGGMIAITQNLFHALRTCFNRYPSRWLWADGICINQEDNAERARQVLVMGYIYRGATMVVAHPGHYTYSRLKPANTEEGVETIVRSRLNDSRDDSRADSTARRSEEQEETTDANDHQGRFNFDPIPVGDVYDSESLQGALSIMTLLEGVWTDPDKGGIHSDRYWADAGLPDPNSEEGWKTWLNLVDFWYQDWYFRTWVFQEVVLANKVVVLYGGTAISFHAITKFWDLARQHNLPRALRIGTVADCFRAVMNLSTISFHEMFMDVWRRRARKAGIYGRNSSDDDDDDDADAADDGDDGGDDGGDDDESLDVPQASLSLLELLCLCRNNLATDPRDKVYGILSLSQDPVAKAIIPDYSDANTVDKLFIHVAEELVKTGQVVDLLQHAGIHQDIPGLPSWVPDWTFQSRSVLPAHLYRCTGRTLPETSILRDMEMPKLAVRGVVISRIKDIGPAWTFYSHDIQKLPFHKFEAAPDLELPNFNDEDARNFIFSFSTKLLRRFNQKYATGDLNDDVARTLAADSSADGRRIGPRNAQIDGAAGESHPNRGVQPDRSATDDFFRGVDAFRRFYARGPESEDDLTAPGIRVHQTRIFMWLLDFDEDVEDELQRQMVTFTSPFQNAQRGRRFATMTTSGSQASWRSLWSWCLGSRKAAPGKTNPATSGSRGQGTTGAGGHATQTPSFFMGTVPWNTASGDYVVMLQGFSTPFVLRKRESTGESDRDDEYRLVGDCYVHGAMDGELMRWADEMDERLGPEYLSTDEDGREFGIYAPQGFVPFQTFTIV